MEKTITWKIFTAYILLIIFMLIANQTFAQVTVTHYNAEWNKANDVKWYDVEGYEGICSKCWTACHCKERNTNAS